jgi:hypothetical protein
MAAGFATVAPLSHSTFRGVPASAWAAILSASISVLEILLSAKKRPAFAALPWVMVLAGFDAAAGLFGYWLVDLAFPNVSWLQGPWKVLVAGLIGPAVLRAPSWRFSAAVRKTTSSVRRIEWGDSGEASWYGSTILVRHLKVPGRPRRQTRLLRGGWRRSPSALGRM